MEDKLLKAKYKRYKKLEDIASKKRIKQTVNCENCTYSEFIKGNWIKSDKIKCLVTEEEEKLNELSFIYLESKAEKCPCFENKYGL